MPSILQITLGPEQSFQLVAFVPIDTRPVEHDGKLPGRPQLSCLATHTKQLSRLAIRRRYGGPIQTGRPARAIPLASPGFRGTPMFQLIGGLLAFFAIISVLAGSPIAGTVFALRPPSLWVVIAKPSRRDTHRRDKDDALGRSIYEARFGR